MSIYARAGIHDIDAFYAAKFVDGSTAHLQLEQSTDAFDIRSAKAVWFYENIARGSEVFDFGCGGGALAVLKKKDCTLTGVELSAEGARAAERAGYDRVLVGQLDALDLPPACFDYIVSLDVFGHIEFGDKDRVIQSLKRLLKPDGVMLHGIESGIIDYDRMSDAELQAYVRVDGHVGVEGRGAILERWRRHFAHVDGELRFVHAKSVTDFVKEALEYGDNQVGDIVHLLDQFSESQQQSFNVAMGMVFRSMETLGTPSGNHHGGFMMLRGSDAPLPPRIPYATGFVAPTVPRDQPIPLDYPGLLAGWHAVEGDPLDGIRWASPEAHLVLRPDAPCRELSLRVSALEPGTQLFAFAPRNSTPLAQHDAGRHRRDFVIPLPAPHDATDPVISLRIDACRFVCPAWTGRSRTCVA